MGKRLLLICHTFLPIAGPRALRWGQFVKYLICQGYEIDILTTLASKKHPAYDEKLLDAIPKEVNVIRTYPGPIYSFSYDHLPPKSNGVKTFGTFLQTTVRSHIKRAFTRIVEPLLIPDKCIVWLPYALIALMKLKKKKYDLIISSGYPFTDHILGYYFKKWTGTKWIVDYGDPWSFYPGFHRWRYYIDKHIEGRLLKNVDHIIVTTESTAKGFVKHYPFLDPKGIDVISQGCDIRKYQEIIPEKGKIFRIVYTGSFYNGLREPYVFFEAIKSLSNQNVEVLIAGHIDSHYVKWVEEKQLNTKIIFLGHQNSQKVIALQKGADVLLLFGWLNGYQIPGKIYEYFGAQRPILAIKYDEQDIAAKIISKQKCGVVVDNRKEDIINVIQHLYNLKQSGQMENHFDHSSLAKYDWQSLARKLEKTIADVLGHKKSPK